MDRRPKPAGFALSGSPGGATCAAPPGSSYRAVTVTVLESRLSTPAALMVFTFTR